MKTPTGLFDANSDKPFLSVIEHINFEREPRRQQHVASAVWMRLALVFKLNVGNVSISVEGHAALLTRWERFRVRDARQRAVIVGAHDCSLDSCDAEVGGVAALVRDVAGVNDPVAVSEVGREAVDRLHILFRSDQRLIRRSLPQVLLDGFVKRGPASASGQCEREKRHTACESESSSQQEDARRASSGGVCIEELRAGELTRLCTESRRPIFNGLRIRIMAALAQECGPLDRDPRGVTATAMHDK